MVRLLLGALALSMVLIAAPAGAATVSATPYVEPPGTEPEESCSRYAQCPGPTVAFQAAPGERNAVTVAGAGGTLVFRDAGAPLTAGAGCTAGPDGAVTCPYGPATIELGDGDDSFQSATPLQVARGGEGADVLAGAQRLEGGGGADSLTGLDGADWLDPGPGADTVVAGPGNDTLVEDPGTDPDRLDGGDGLDLLTFSERSLPVVVRLGARPQLAGSHGEANVATGIERVYGGRGDDDMATDPRGGESASVGLDGLGGDDRLEIRGPVGARLDGGPGDDELEGGPGDDELVGGDGDDGLRGDEGDDTLTGGYGLDTMLGGAGDDLLSGGAGPDRLSGGAGRDRFSGGSGRDAVTASDGRRERVDCGPGRDRITADRRDRLRRCERLRRR